MLGLGKVVLLWALHLLGLLSSFPRAPGPWCIVPHLSVGVREQSLGTYRFAATIPYTPQSKFLSSPVKGNAEFIVALVR